MSEFSHLQKLLSFVDCKCLCVRVDVVKYCCCNPVSSPGLTLITPKHG